jgi:ribonuclease HIII
MQNFTTTLKSADVAKVHQRLKQYQTTKSNNKYLLYFYRMGEHTISIFTSYKILIQGPHAKETYQKIVNGSVPTKTSFKPTYDKNKQVTIANYIGCDEVGVGDYFGGLVTCAVYLEKSKEQTLARLGVSDSKDLNDAQMIRLVPQIKQECAYECTVITPSEYNKLVSKYKNTHIVKAYLHDITIKRLAKKLKLGQTAIVVMDQFAPRNTYNAYFAKIGTTPYEITRFETKAENKYLAVAAASIIARVAFLEQINQLSKQARMPLLLGASNPKIIEQARTIYINSDKNQLEKFVKIDFATTKKVINI